MGCVCVGCHKAWPQGDTTAHGFAVQTRKFVARNARTHIRRKVTFVVAAAIEASAIATFLVSVVFAVVCQSLFRRAVIAMDDSIGGIVISFVTNTCSIDSRLSVVFAELTCRVILVRLLACLALIANTYCRCVRVNARNAAVFRWIRTFACHALRARAVRGVAHHWAVDLAASWAATLRARASIGACVSDSARRAVRCGVAALLQTLVPRVAPIRTRAGSLGLRWYRVRLTSCALS